MQWNRLASLNAPPPSSGSFESRLRKICSFLSTTLLIVFCSVVAAVAWIATIPTAEAESGRRTYVVRRGDTLRAIAKRNGLTTDDLAVANDINPEKSLSIGRSLKIPRLGNVHYRVVRTGDTASKIAREAGCTIADLRLHNKLRKSARLAAGQVLKLPPQDPGPRKGNPRASKRRTHILAQGESLNSVAHQYGIGTKILRRANGIRNPRSLRPGRVLLIPDPVVRSSKKAVSVRPIQRARRVSGEAAGAAVIHWAIDGQTWKSIARAYRKNIKSLQKVNRRLGKRLVPGDPVRIPGVRVPVAVRVANCGYPGIRFVRAERKRTIRLVDCKGRVSTRGRKQLSAIAAPRKSRATRLIHPELARRLQRVADEFPGRPLRVVSGYRAPAGERGASRHNYGRALDFSVQGVSNRRLFEFCRQLPSTGCGLYPNSTFVHMDYRDESAHWVDHAGPGEAPDYSTPDP